MGSPMTDDQAKAVLLLWATREFDTCDIALLLSLPEAAVARTIGAARALMAGRPETLLGGGR